MYTCVISIVDAQGDIAIWPNCAMANDWPTPEGLHNQQHCKVLMGEHVAESYIS